MSFAVVFRSTVFTGLSTFIPLYVRQRMHGSTTAGTIALFLLFLCGAVGSAPGGFPANRYDRVSRWSCLLSIVAVPLGLTVSADGLVGPPLGRLADRASLQTALTPLIAMPALSRGTTVATWAGLLSQRPGRWALRSVEAAGDCQRLVTGSPAWFSYGLHRRGLSR